MKLPTLHLANVGPLQDAPVEFGDLTVLVGPQASGKSICLQFLRLMLDPGPVMRELKKHGIVWTDRKSFLERYLGEGMSAVWRADSRMRWDGEEIDLGDFVRPKRRRDQESSFLIPAQRVLAISRDGWLRPFSDYRGGDPYSIRDFSENLRELLEAGLGAGEALYPQPRRLKQEIRNLLSESIFSGFDLQVVSDGAQKRLMLTKGEVKLPYMVWSAGQREFVPLLLGLYWLLPPAAVERRASVQWAVIEELEMGLHPKAIEAVLFIVLELLWRGYRVCLSTHSSQVLDLVWALSALRACKANPKEVLRIFGLKPTGAAMKVAEAALTKSTRVYYFDRATGSTRDISKLDPGSRQPLEADWGGLTELASRVGDIVAENVNRAEMEI